MPAHIFLAIAPEPERLSRFALASDPSPYQSVHILPAARFPRYDSFTALPVCPRCARLPDASAAGRLRRFTEGRHDFVFDVWQDSLFVNEAAAGLVR